MEKQIRQLLSKHSKEKDMKLQKNPMVYILTKKMLLLV